MDLEEEVLGDLDAQQVGDDEERRARRRTPAGAARSRAWCSAGSAGWPRRPATTAITETSRGREGRLRRNGTRRVRMTNTMSVWVASDSTNQPERNSGAAAWKTQSMTAKVAKSKTELIGPKRIMNRRMKRDVPVRRSGQLLLVDAVGRDRHLAGVVEQVVEQDLERQHRQERQERGGDGDAEHVAEVRRRAHEHVLDGVGEDAPTLGHAVGEHVEVLARAG